jgi:ribosome-associated toxin RatA of RatAB toxin-antitoxin module
VKSSIGIEIAAPPDLVYWLARDVERWPLLLPHYAAAHRLAPPDAEGRILVRFVARRVIIPLLGLGLPVAWRSLTWSDPGHRRIRFVHRGGATNGMDVTWRIEPDRDDERACRVDIEHDFGPRVAGWAWLIDRLFTRPIAERTLRTFRVLAEALRDESAGRSTANPRS